MEWYKWYPALYQDETLHLNLEQDAIYRRLIDYYMTIRMPLPYQSIALARICQISLDKWEEHSETILPFFRKIGSKLHQKRCDIELDRQDSVSKKLGDAARKAHEERKKNKQLQEDISQGNAEANALPPIEERRGEENRIEKEEGTPSLFRFSGRVIRLTELDYKRWEQSFRNIDLISELQKRDDWLAEHAEKQNGWFLSTSSYFAKINSQRSTKKSTGHRVL